MAVPEMTKTQRLFYDLMADGLKHRLAEFRMVMNDDLASEAVIAMHISNLRAIVRPLGEDITCEREYQAKTYRRVRTLQQHGE